MRRALGRVAASCLCLALLGLLQLAAGVLEYDRAAITGGQLWRLWSGHLVHASSEHLLLNALVALALYFGFFARVRLRELLLAAVLIAPLISLGLLVLTPEMSVYSGLSGLLHGLVVYASLRLARSRHPVYWLGLGFVWLKVCAEWLAAQAGQISYIANALIVPEAHAMGAMFGTLVAVASLLLLGNQVRFNTIDLPDSEAASVVYQTGFRKRE